MTQRIFEFPECGTQIIFVIADEETMCLPSCNVGGKKQSVLNAGRVNGGTSAAEQADEMAKIDAGYCMGIGETVVARGSVFNRVHGGIFFIAKQCVLYWREKDSSLSTTGPSRSNREGTNWLLLIFSIITSRLGSSPGRLPQWG